MQAAGIDVGSRTIKLVVLDVTSGDIVSYRRTETTFNPHEQCQRILSPRQWDALVATGYGRKLVQENFEAHAITEIQAHALGARKMFPQCKAILDIGGQDTKAIALDERGKVRKFEMNDRCAAGTGKFLEFMATSFQVPIERFGDFALSGNAGLTINSMCTVFAEAEATSLMARGHNPQDIALALHLSVVKRSVSMLKRVATESPLVFSGGVARNRCVATLVAKELNSTILIPPEPDLIGALGAALHCRQRMLSGDSRAQS
uniref:3-hydroxyacyl-ACP dehydratase n=1 Tax=Desulfomonile tiedjei TaxID=2358 RepID=A0A7C4ASN3_9BACT